VDSAIREYRVALEVDPKYAKVRNYVGLALYARGDVDGAIREFRVAIDLDPEDAKAHYNLGNVLRDQGDVDGAIKEYHLAIDCDPKHANAHLALGQALLQQGRFDEARTSTRNALQLFPPDHSLRPLASGQLQQCETLLALDQKLPTVLSGEGRPAGPDEAATLADLCGRYKKLFAAAACFYGDAFAADPKLADDLRAANRYNAACYAALAGCGQGKDGAGLGEEKCGKLRQMALSWLRADLDAWCRLLEKEEEKTRSAVARQLAHWLQDQDFAGVRGAESLARLPEAERKDWQQLWEEVEGLRRRAAEPPPAANSARP
jgi:tetratricopeptide (TPR) repeat protein